MKNNVQSLYILSVLIALVLAGCSDSGGSNTDAVEAQLAEDIPGNVNTLIQNRAPVEDVNDHPDEDRYTFFDFDTGETISDSTSAEWDIAFNGTTILANAGNGGGITLVDDNFDNVEEAPTTGYEESNDGWYTYTGAAPNGPQHAVLPNEDQTLIVQTADGLYAKVQILSYYEGNPDSSTDEFANLQTRPASGYFTFNYVLQNNESTELNHSDRITYFDLETGDVVQDSLSPQWDLGFSRTTIIANANNEGGVQSLNIAFEDVDEAPTSGYDDEVSDWYTYTGQAPSGPQHAVLVNEGTTLLVQTPEGNYGKVRILSYYQGNPDTSSDEFINSQTRPASPYFTFEYAVQTDGSVNFE